MNNIQNTQQSGTTQTQNINSSVNHNQLLQDNENNFKILKEALLEYKNKQNNFQTFDEKLILKFPNNLKIHIYKNLNNIINNRTKEILLDNQNIPDIDFIKNSDQAIERIDAVSIDDLKNDPIGSFGIKIFDNIKNKRSELEKEAQKGNNVVTSQPENTQSISKQLSDLATELNRDKIFDSAGVKELTYDFVAAGNQYNIFFNILTDAAKEFNIDKNNLLKKYNSFKKQDKTQIEEFYKWIFEPNQKTLWEKPNSKAQLFFQNLIGISGSVEPTLKDYYDKNVKSNNNNTDFEDLLNIQSSSSQGSAPQNNQPQQQNIQSTTPPPGSNSSSTASTTSTFGSELIDLLSKSQWKNKLENEIKKIWSSVDLNDVNAINHEFKQNPLAESQVTSPELKKLIQKYSSTGTTTTGNPWKKDIENIIESYKHDIPTDPNSNYYKFKIFLFGIFLLNINQSNWNDYNVFDKLNVNILDIIKQRYDLINKTSISTEKTGNKILEKFKILNDIINKTDYEDLDKSLKQNYDSIKECFQYILLLFTEKVNDNNTVEFIKFDNEIIDNNHSSNFILKNNNDIIYLEFEESITNKGIFAKKKKELQQYTGKSFDDWLLNNDKTIFKAKDYWGQANLDYQYNLYEPEYTIVTEPDGTTKQVYTNNNLAKKYYALNGLTESKLI